METVGEQLEGGKFLLADFDPFRLVARAELASNPKAGSRCCRGDQDDDDFRTYERFVAPVLRNK
jgi:hypothetical protein